MAPPRRPLVGTLVATVVAAGVVTIAIVEIGLLAMAVGGPRSMQELVLVHAWVAASSMALSVVAWFGGIRAAAFYLFVLVVAVAGPLGVAGATTMSILQGFHSRRSIPFERWHAEFFSEPRRDEVEELDDRIARWGAASCGNGSVASFADVMAAGTITQKQSVLGLIADHFDPAYSSVLRGALNDPEPVIRVQAASVAARLEDDVQKKGVRLRQRLEEDRSDPCARAELARFYRASSRAGLADDFSAAALRREALERLAGLSAQFPRDGQILAARAELLLDDGQAEAAIELLHPLAQGDDPDPDLIGTYLAALLGARRFDEMQRLAGRIKAAAIRAPALEELKPVLDFWRAPEAIGRAGSHHAPTGAGLTPTLNGASR